MTLLMLQIILTVSQIMWGRDITEILEGDFDRLASMEDFEQKSYSVSMHNVINLPTTYITTDRVNDIKICYM